MSKKKRVFCCNCEYYQEERFVMPEGTSNSYSIEEACLSPKNKGKIIYTYKCATETHLLPETLNNFNNCRFYKERCIQIKG